MQAFRPYWIWIFVFLLVPVAFAEDAYKPYLHEPVVGEHPGLELFGSYSTNLFPGAATYSYDLIVPPGTNGLQPQISLQYNHQAARDANTIAGSGWSIPQTYVYRHVNFTPGDDSDDYFMLVLQGSTHELKYDPSKQRFRTEIETFIRIENLSTTTNDLGMYWRVTLKDGTQFSLGRNTSSEYLSDMHGHGWKWYVDSIRDTSGNTIWYEYLENPFPEDFGATYLDRIVYNNDQKRVIDFIYEQSNRPDLRSGLEQANFKSISRRLSAVNISFGDKHVREYQFTYTSLNNQNTLSSLSNVTLFGVNSTAAQYSITFDYYETINGYFNGSTYDVPVFFSNGSGLDRGVRLADVNRDGMVDIVYGPSGASSQIYFNTGSNWEEQPVLKLPETIVDSLHNEKGMRLVDINGDGLTDLLQGYYGTRRAWINNGTNFTRDYSFDPPFAFYTGIDEGVRMVDVNGDGYQDVMYGRGANTTAVYGGGPTGWENRTNYHQNRQFFVEPDGTDLGVRIVELNGDGMPDFIRGFRSTNTHLESWINNGSGWINDSRWMPPAPFTIENVADKGFRFVDVNGDGLTDMLQDLQNASGSFEESWINNGSGWMYTSEIWGGYEPFKVGEHNKGVRQGDVNGDGFADIIVSYDEDNEQHKRVWIRNATYPYLLKSIRNEFGGITEISYKSSALSNNTDSDGLGDLGFNVWVVANATINNSLNGPFAVVTNTSYDYFYGKFDYEESTFAGFGWVDEILPDGALVRHQYNQTLYARGNEYATSTYDSGGLLLLRQDLTYGVSAVNQTLGIYRTDLVSEQTDVYDGFEIPVSTGSEFSYDQYGNMIAATEFGDLNKIGDETYSRSEFVYNSSAWLVDRLHRYQLFDSTNQTKVRETIYYYDNSLDSVKQGRLTSKEEYLDAGTGNPVESYTYDSYGNPVRQTDALGNTIIFDYGGSDTTNTFPDRRINELGHALDYTYDAATGNILLETRHGVDFESTYDSLGRISKEIQPYDSSLLPTKSYEYDFDGIAPEIIKISQKTTGNYTIDTYYVYDGFANLVQVKTPAAKGQQAIKNIFYDGQFRVDQEQNPYFHFFSEELAISGGTPFINYTYDALSRIVRVENPDGTAKQTIFDQKTIHDYDGNNNVKTYYLDANDRIVAVQEHNTDYYLGVDETYNTTYSYNAVDELVGIRDHHGNEFNFSYNSLGQKVQLDDPDLGTWSYGYDFAGNLISQIDNIGNEISIGYDGLHRITAKNASSGSIRFSYDQQYPGTLTTIAFDNYSLSYQYDDRLRVVTEALKEGNSSVGIQIFESNSMFDSADRLVQLTVPSDDELEYYFDAAGQVSAITGYLNATAYNAFGSPLNRSYFNGKVTSFDYNSFNARLSHIATSTDQDLLYTYDSVGNIIEINDNANDRVHRMSYDKLDRLTNASINEYDWVYSYDALGNILKIVRNFSTTTSFKMGDIPHAPATVIETPTAIDVYKEDVLNETASVVSFYLVNEKNDTLADANWTASFESGNEISGSVPLILEAGEHALVVVEHTYTSGGSYAVNLSGRTGSSVSDHQSIPLMLGALVGASEILVQNATLVVSSFTARNNWDTASDNWSWNCDNGASSSASFSLGAHEEIIVVSEHNYSLSNNSVGCAVSGDDGNQSTVLALAYDGLTIEGFNVSLHGDSGIEVRFEITNSFTTQEVSWNVSVDGQMASSTSPTSLDQGESLGVVQGFNFTTRGVKNVMITAYSDDFVDTYAQNTRLYSLDLIDFLNVVKNGTARIFNFAVHNDWTHLTAFWNVSNPVVSDTVNLSKDEAVLIVIENEFDSGIQQVDIELYNETGLEDRLTEMFIVKAIEINDFDLLDTIGVATVTNNVADRGISWSFDSGGGAANSSVALDLAKDEMSIVVVESSIEAGVHPVSFVVNSSELNDSAVEVAVI